MDEDKSFGLLILGGGGHAGVVIRVLSELCNISNTLNSISLIKNKIENCIITGADEAFMQECRDLFSFSFPNINRYSLLTDVEAADVIAHDRENIWCLFNGIGPKPNIKLLRQRRVVTPQILRFENGSHNNIVFPPLIHPSVTTLDVFSANEETFVAHVGPGRIGSGVQVHANSIIGGRSTIGKHSIINTRVSIDHDCRIGSHAFVGPGAVLCGGVTIGDHAFIGAGATILPGIKIGRGSLVPAGYTIDRDVHEYTIAANRYIPGV